MADLTPGQRVDRYVVEGKLGEGGMAVVYRVRHETLGTLHALKVLTLSGRRLRERMVREGQAQAKIDHENVVPVTDVLTVGRRPGLLMPFISGPSLEAWLGRYAPTLEESLTLFRGICAGVGHAHARGIVHRDLKPANVLLAMADGRLVPKVSDFGLAKDLERSGATGIGATIGTPGYMAPEQSVDARSVDRRADLWSLGCVLYRLVCGVPPFDGDETAELLRAVQAGDRVPTRRLRPDLPDRVHDAIDRLLEVDPARRLADCDVLMGWLDHRLDRLPPPPATLGPATAPTTLLPRWLEGGGDPFDVARAIADETLAALPKLDRDEWTAEEERSSGRHRRTRAAAADARASASQRPTVIKSRRELREAIADRRIDPGPISPPRGPERPEPSDDAPAARGPWAGMVLAASLMGAFAVAALLVTLGTAGMVMIVRSRPAVPVQPPLAVAGPEDVGDEEVEEHGGDADPVPASPASTAPRPRPRPAPRPAPEAAPSDEDPAEAGAPRPEPAGEDPDAAGSGPGRVTFSGVEEVWLVPADGSGGEHRDLGAVPPGRYRVFAVFPSIGGASGAGEIEVRPGETTHLTCIDDFARCKPQ